MPDDFGEDEKEQSKKMTKKEHSKNSITKEKKQNVITSMTVKKNS